VRKTCPVDAMQQYHGAVKELFRLACDDSGEAARSVVVYGEYFGGWYPDPHVQQRGAGAGAPVQEGVVAYAPAHHFYAFDVCIDGTYLDFDVASDLLRKAGFPLVATPVVEGTFEECVAMDVENFKTRIPALLGLKVCKPYDIAEGLVIRPVSRNGHDDWFVKKKSLRYLEGNPEELRKWLKICMKEGRKEEAFEGLYLSLCQRPRLDAVLSKDPQLYSIHSLPFVQKMYCEDVEKDLALERKKVGWKESKGCYDAARITAQKRVQQWFLESLGGC